MNIRWVVAPCKDCPERYVGCHSSCARYGEYLRQHNAEKKRMYAEDVTTGQINELNWGSSRKKEKRKGALKHGYKPKRR